MTRKERQDMEGVGIPPPGAYTEKVAHLEWQPRGPDFNLGGVEYRLRDPRLREATPEVVAVVDQITGGREVPMRFIEDMGDLYVLTESGTLLKRTGGSAWHCVWRGSSPAAADFGMAVG